MSKTLFNQNTFQNKNVTNSGEVQSHTVSTLTATTIVNTELQDATTDIATNRQNIQANTSSITNKQDTLSASNLLNPNFIDAVNDGDPVTITTGEFGALTGFDNAGGATIQGEIDKKADDYDVTAPLVKTTNILPILGANTVNLSVNHTASTTSGSTALITSGGCFDAVDAKQDRITAGDGIDLTGNTLSFDGVMTGSIVTSGSVTGATMNYISSGVVTNIKDEIDGKQNTLTSADNAGAGIAISGSGEISVNLSLITGQAAQTLPQALSIVSDADTQLLITAASNTSQDAKMILRGRRNGSTSTNVAEIRFENYDQDITGAESNALGSIVGRVSTAVDNYGGLLFNNFADGDTQTTAMNMSSNGNFALGDGATFQNDYKFKNSGTTNLAGLNYIKPNMRLLAYDKDDILGAAGTLTSWGNGSFQINVVNDRQIGANFCTVSAGQITLTKNGYYRIRASAQTQSDGYNDRVSFLNYLRITESGVTTQYDQSQNRNFFGWTYIRNNNDGGHGSVTFEDYIYLTVGDTIAPQHKLETTGDRNFNNTLPAANIDNYLNIQIERIYDTNPE